MDPDDTKNSKLTISIGGKEITPSSTYTYDTSIDTNDIVYTGCSTGCIDSSYSFAPTYTVGDMNDTGGEFSINFDDFNPRPEVWPSQHIIEEMIKEYPALALQYTRFIELYNLCKDDYYSGKKNDGLV